MAKIRPQSGVEGKAARFVSTSDIFKKHRAYGPTKDRRQQPSFPHSASGTSKRKRRTEHPLSEAVAENIEESRQRIEKQTTARLATVRDDLVTEMHTIVQDARDQTQRIDSSSEDVQRPLDDELLEFTRMDGTVVTMSLGKRMNAYRKLFNREQQNWDRLSTEWQEVTQEINDLATEIFGPKGVESILKSTGAGLPESSKQEEPALVAELEAEKERARVAAAAIGAKAIKKMKTGEKDLTVKHKQNMIQLCNSMFGEDEG